jgi:hypothetical protein
VVSGPELSAASSPGTSVYQADATNSVARSATFTPIRVLLLISTALALIGLLAFAVVPARLRRLIYAGRRGSIAEPIRSAPQMGMPDELKRNLRDVLQTLEAQLRGDVELEEALAQRRSRKPA